VEKGLSLCGCGVEGPCGKGMLCGGDGGVDVGGGCEGDGGDWGTGGWIDYVDETGCGCGG